MSKQKKRETVHYLNSFVDGMISIMEEMWSILTFGAYRPNRNPINWVKNDDDKLTPEERYQKLYRQYGIETHMGKIATDIVQTWLKTIADHTSVSASFCQQEIIVENLPVTSPVAKQSGLKLILDHQKNICRIRE